jgi:hypothetical protein
VYCVPNNRVCLLSTLALLQTYTDEESKVDASKLTYALSGNSNGPSHGAIDAYFNPKTNPPTSTAYHSSDTKDAALAIHVCISSVSKANSALSEPQ